MSELNVRIDDEEVREGLQAIARELPAELEAAGRKIAVKIGSTAVRNYMRDAGTGAGPRSPSDTGPLRIVTSRLARSLLGRNFAGTRESLNSVTMEGSKVIITVGSRVPYAHIHEKGFSGTVQVRQHYRRSAADDVLMDYTKKGKATFISQGIMPVRAHTRKAAMPARPYLEPAYNECEPWVIRRITDGFYDLVREHLQ